MIPFARLFSLQFFLIICSSPLYTQIAPDKYWIQFTDKNYSSFSTDRPLEFLSPKAMERREKHSISINQQDIPVSEVYIDSLEKLGLTILNKSKWFNAVTVFSNDQALIDTIHNLGFVANRQKVVRVKAKYPHPEEKFSQEFKPVYGSKKSTSDFYQYGTSANQVKMMKGEFLHNQGFTGTGIQIAVIDAGFQNANILPSLSALFQTGRILGTKDFVSPGNSVFNEHQHGTNVLSVIGSESHGQLIGTAPQASFWLIRTEDDMSEYLVEEDNWVSAAEFADSAGVDIINSSLGYTVFDDPGMNHTYQDMDGKTTRISMAAGIAASKGILLFVSAGNEGNKTWRYVSAPADSDSVLAIGAVNSSGNYVAFSSRGPTSDGRIKPDITAMGQDVVLQTANSGILTGSGTSFSSPLVAGLAACLWQAFPDAKVWEIKKAIIESASQFKNPDYLKGYGIPNFEKAFKILDSTFIDLADSKFPFRIYPNPFSGQISVEAIRDLPGNVIYTIYSLEGKLVANGIFHSMSPGEIKIIPFPESIKQGVYILRLTSGQISVPTLIIKN